MFIYPFCSESAMTSLREIFNDNGPEIATEPIQEQQEKRIVEESHPVEELNLEQPATHRPILPSPKVSVSRLRKMRAEVRAALKKEFPFHAPQNLAPHNQHFLLAKKIREKKKEYYDLAAKLDDLEPQLTAHKGMFARNLAALDHKLAKL